MTLKYLFYIVILSLIFMFIEIHYTIIMINPQLMGIRSIKLNQIIFCLVELSTFTISGQLINMFTRKRYLRSMMFLFMLISASFYLIKAFSPQKSQNMQILELGLSILTKIFLCLFYGVMYVYMVEIFPTVLRGFAMGVIIFIGRLANCAAAYYSTLSNGMGIHPLSNVGLLALALLPFLLFLPETYNSQLK